MCLSVRHRVHELSLHEQQLLPSLSDLRRITNVCVCVCVCKEDIWAFLQLETLSSERDDEDTFNLSQSLDK